MDSTAHSHHLKSAIERADHILIVIHQQPDADALGSLTALSEWFEQLNKRHLGFCRGTTLGDCSFINEQRQLIADHRKLASHHFDLVIVLDSGDLRFAGFDTVLPQFKTKPLVINIDHHATNELFGDINVVDHQAAATTEILYKLFRTMEVTITPRMASALMAGIINDTYGFTNPNTSAECLTIAGQLLKAGAKLPQVTNAILKNKTVPAMQLWGTILTRLHSNPDLNIATTVIADHDLENNPASNEVTEGISNFLNNLSGVNAALVLRQDNNNTIKGSLRTNSDLIDVSKLAILLGGGGHRKAAGFTIKGTLVQTKDGYWQII
jgi:bifunctional oligoribonuclease and PAP phosphatase NrnA